MREVDVLHNLKEHDAETNGAYKMSEAEREVCINCIEFYIDNLVRNTFKKTKCCFCGAHIEGWGNNPEPLIKDEDARCCDDCNGTIVLPIRLLRAKRV